MLVDEDAFNAQEIFRVTDVHGTQENVESYKAALLEEGFREASLTQADGSEITVYRRLLREEYGCYASVYPYYDNGFVLEAGGIMTIRRMTVWRPSTK
jgi:GR25 family glycosyltransferase involved in LPS biosynthesis